MKISLSLSIYLTHPSIYLSVFFSDRFLSFSVSSYPSIFALFLSFFQSLQVLLSVLCIPSISPHLTYMFYTLKFFENYISNIKMRRLETLRFFLVAPSHERSDLSGYLGVCLYVCVCVCILTPSPPPPPPLAKGIWDNTRFGFIHVWTQKFFFFQNF